MALPVTISGLSTAVACVGPFQSSWIEVQTSQSTYSTFGRATTNTYASQCFTTKAGQTSISSVKVQLGKNGSPTAGIFAQIYAADANNQPTGSPIGGSSQGFDGTTLLTTGPTWAALRWLTPVTVSPSTKYCVAFYIGDVGSDTNYYRWYMDVVTSDTGYSYSQNATTWTTVNDRRATLIVYGDGITDNHAYYFFGQDVTSGNLDAYKATDPTSSWDEVATIDITGTNTGNGQLSAYQVGDIIHIAANGGSVSAQRICYVQFDMSADAFGTAEQPFTGLTTNGQTGSAQRGISIVVRSNGNAVAFFNGAQTKKSGTNYARVYWSERTTGWSAPAEVDDGGQYDNAIPNAALGLSDRVHFFWGNNSNALGYARSISSANSFDTQAQFSNIAAYKIASVSYANGADIDIVLGSANNSSYYCTSGADPTITQADLETSASTPKTYFNDGTDVYALYRLITDSDLYVAKSTNNGASWGTSVNVMTATVTQDVTSLSRDGNIYQRGNSIVIPYVVNDNGTLKYNEYEVRSLGPTTWQGAAKIDGAGGLFADAHNNRQYGAALLDGAGAMKADAASRILAAAAKMDGGGGLLVNAIRAAMGAAKFSGSGGLLANADFAFQQGAAALNGLGGLLADAQVRIAWQAAGLIDGAGNLKANAMPVLAALAKLDGAGALFADSFIQHLEQDHFRFRTDALGVDSTPTWAAAQDGTFDPGANPFRIRFSVSNPLPNDPFNAGSLQLYCSKNGGPYQPVTLTSTFGVKASAGASSDADETPLRVKRLTGTT